jgi:hypothetical protein
MRFDSGINLFFHLGLWLNVPRAVLAVDSLSFTKNHQEMSTQCFANFWVFSEGSAPRRNCGGTIRTDDVDCCGRRPPLRSPESREQKTIHRTESRFRRWCLDSINPGAIARARRELRPWCLPLRNRAVAAT